VDLIFKNPWECKRFSARRLTSNNRISNKNWKRQTLDHFLRNLRTTASIEYTPGSGRSRAQSPRAGDSIAAVTLRDVQCDAVMTSSSH